MYEPIAAGRSGSACRCAPGLHRRGGRRCKRECSMRSSRLPSVPIAGSPSGRRPPDSWHARRVRCLVALLALAALVTDSLPADACAPAPPKGAEVRIADEEAVIMWDAATKTETFIRRAQFHSTAKSFGFLVPTPTKPELGEASQDLFPALADVIRPETRIEQDGTSFEFAPVSLVCMVGAAKKGEPEAASAVRVIQSAHVAGMNAVTLEADDPAALSAWLGEHGFDASPELEAWLAPFVAQHWKLTAFVIGTEQRDGDQFEMSTKSVKMTFTADAPFYPYSEPAPPKDSTMSSPPRMLRVFFVSDQRYTGRLGDAPWLASTLYSAPVELPREFGITGKRTTVFIDEAPVRAGHDEVTFVPHTDQSEVRPPPFIVKRKRHILVPLEAFALLGIIVILVVRKRMKRTALPSD